MRRVAILVHEGVQSLDVTGPLEVFHTAGRLASGAYDARVVSLGGAPVRTSSGLTLQPEPAGTDPLDTLIVAGGSGVHAAANDPAHVGWVRDAARRSRRTASVCTGAFLLAAAGLLDGRRATTHWAHCERLRGQAPGATVEGDPLYVRDGDVATSAGVTAGIDLSLALVEEDLGAATALETARWLVVFARRPGGQSQFAAAAPRLAPAGHALREVQARIAADPAADLSVPALAGLAGMTPRTFARAFRRATGTTPGAYVEEARVAHARALLEGGAGVEEAARGAGFRSAETLRRAFHRRLHVSPAGYRDRFGAAA